MTYSGRHGEYRQNPLARQVTRRGHDRRYAIDATKIETELSWFPAETFETGFRKTVLWYLNNQQWIDNITSGAYREEETAPKQKLSA